MKCPICKTNKWKIQSTYKSKKTGYYVRKRKCKKCGKVVKTFEVPEKHLKTYELLVDDLRNTIKKFLKRNPKY
jgi:transcriptional regulator NrdR family protein